MPAEAASSADESFLRRALELAEGGRYRTAPNPRVGCVLVQKDGRVVGEGWHRQLGGPHAEVEALRAAGEAARGATAYVSLEPCCHHGRTPPCTEALLTAGVARVVACHRDPNPRVAGQGFARLRAAGVEVREGLLVDEAVRLNLPFLVSQSLGRPAVTLKWAMSLDGRIATVSGESQWISSEDGRRWGLEQREEHDAILVGIGTALADDPRLDRRLGLAPRPNLRIVLDRRLRLPSAARMLDVEGPVLVYTEAAVDSMEAAEQRRRLADRGAEVVILSGGITAAGILADLNRRGVQSLLVEGGGMVHAAFVEAGLFDRVAVDCAPLLLGGDAAPGPVRGAGFGALALAPRLEDLRCEPRGGDLILTGYRNGCLRELSSSVAA